MIKIMFDKIDDTIREIADNYAEPDKKGELLTTLRDLKKDIIQEVISQFNRGVDSVKKDIEVHNL